MYKHKYSKSPEFFAQILTAPEKIYLGIVELDTEKA